MSDIVERLAAEYQLPGRTVSKGRLLMEARAEIERLRADLRASESIRAIQADEIRKLRDDRTISDPA